MRTDQSLVIDVENLNADKESMAFELLFNRPMSEAELLKKLTRELQSHFFTYQNESYFIKLGKVEDRVSQIIWVRSFPDAHSLLDFYYDTKLQRACILIRFEKDRYKIFCGGFHWCRLFEVWIDRESEGRPFELTLDCESFPMPSRELIEKGFGELTGILLNTKRPKAI